MKNDFEYHRALKSINYLIIRREYLKAYRYLISTRQVSDELLQEMIHSTVFNHALKVLLNDIFLFLEQKIKLNADHLFKLIPLIEPSFEANCLCDLKTYIENGLRHPTSHLCLFLIDENAPFHFLRMIFKYKIGLDSNALMILIQFKLPTFELLFSVWDYFSPDEWPVLLKLLNKNRPPIINHPNQLLKLIETCPISLRVYLLSILKPYIHFHLTEFSYLLKLFKHIEGEGQQFIILYLKESFNKLISNGTQLNQILNTIQRQSRLIFLQTIHLDLKDLLNSEDFLTILHSLAPSDRLTFLLYFGFQEQQKIFSIDRISKIWYEAHPKQERFYKIMPSISAKELHKQIKRLQKMSVMGELTHDEAILKLFDSITDYLHEPANQNDSFFKHLTSHFAFLLGFNDHEREASEHSNLYHSHLPLLHPC